MLKPLLTETITYSGTGTKFQEPKILEKKTKQAK